MNLAIYGAAGMLGSRLTQEALNRGHQVTALVRNTGKLKIGHDKLTELQADARLPDDVAKKVKGHQAVITSVSPRGDGGVDGYLQAVDAVRDGCKKAGVKRLLWIGGAGSLEVAPGKLLIDQPGFPPEYLPEARAGLEALKRFREEKDLDWTFASPAALLAPGERTGKFKLGGEQLLTNPQGESRISAEDFAFACIYQIEKGGKIRERFTAAYVE